MQSIEWLIASAKPTPIDIRSLMPSYKPLPASVLALDKTWFADESLALSIHGVRHLVRVCLFTWILIQQQKLTTHWGIEDIDHLATAALLHDLRRLNDNADTDHGRRSANWAEQTAKLTDKSALFAIAYHNDDEIPASHSQKALEMLRLLKTADALDRYRLPRVKWWPDLSRMPLPVDPMLVELCKYATIETERITCGMEDFEDTLRAIRQWLSQAHLV